ncbi:MAG: DnaJ domain-containing protein [Polyangia bacterium]
MRSPYDVLGVPPSASQEEIRRAYRRRAREVHPDVCGEGKRAEWDELKAAYECLMPPRQAPDLLFTWAPIEQMAQQIDPMLQQGIHSLRDRLKARAVQPSADGQPPGFVRRVVHRVGPPVIDFVAEAASQAVSAYWEAIWSGASDVRTSKR